MKKRDQKWKKKVFIVFAVFFSVFCSANQWPFHPVSDIWNGFGFSVCEACPRNTQDSAVSGINLNLNQLPGPMRLMKSKYASSESRAQAAQEAASLASNWMEAYESYRQNGEPDYVSGQVAQINSDSEARFEISVSAHYLSRYLSWLYSNYGSYEEAIRSKTYFLYIQAAKCFISMNNVCFDGMLNADYRTVYDTPRNDDGAHKVYESYYSADYKRLDNLHGPHSTPVLWFDDHGTEPSARSGAGMISSPYSEDYGTDFDLVPISANEVASASVEDFHERIAFVSLDKLPEAMKFTASSKNLYKVYLDISDNLKSQHSNFENYQHWGNFCEYDTMDASYEQLFEAATQVFQFMYIISKESKDNTSYTEHEKYPLYEQACKCFININEMCFADSFGNEDLSITSAGVTANVFAMDVESVIAAVPLANPDQIGSALWLDDYTCLLMQDETKEEEKETLMEDLYADYLEMYKRQMASQAALYAQTEETCEDTCVTETIDLTVEEEPPITQLMNNTSEPINSSEQPSEKTEDDPVWMQSLEKKSKISLPFMDILKKKKEQKNASFKIIS